MNFDILRSAENRENQQPTTSNPRAQKRRRVSPEIPLSEITRNLHFLLQEDNNRMTIVDVTDRDAFMNCGTTLLERSKKEINDEIDFK